MDICKKDSLLWDKNAGCEEKLDYIISELTLDEKMHMLASGSGGVERLGIPDCLLGGEAAHGVVARNFRNGEMVKDITTSFPQPVGMSSSWDKQAIRQAGRITGTEARIVYRMRPWGGLSRWAPTVDLLRDPRWGRNEEAYGEDPVQAGAMASSYIKGIQGDDREHLTAAATLKHFYANNTEIGRGWKNSSISPRNKYELYIEPFRRCIEDGGAEGVMAAYNRINGVQGLFNNEMNTLLKDEFGVTHAVSDGGAMELSAAFSHATAMDAETVAASIKAGIDALSGWPDGVYSAVCEAYEMGLLTEEDMDTAIKNTYRTRIRLGLFDENDDKETPGSLCSEEARRVCKDLTDRALVLLKNDGLLPLGEDFYKSAVLIGPVGDKWYKDWYEGEEPERISLLDGLKAKASEAGSDITYVEACDHIVLKCGDRYVAADEEGRVCLSDEPDEFVLEDWGENSYTLRNAATGKYLNTRLAQDAIEGIAAAEEASAIGNTIAGKVYADSEQIFSWFDLEVFRMDKVRPDDDGNGKIIMRDRFGNRLYADKDGYVVTSKEDYPGLTPLSFNAEIRKCGTEEAVSAAASAKTVILALGHNPMVNSKEEIDRSTIDFIPYQQKLFDEIYRVNPNIAVVLMSDYPFAVNEINDKARAILWSATGSQCMGMSIADALTGSVHPAGRLAQTWYRSDRDLPSIDDYDIIGKGRTYRFFEGEVLYPFGYGLTYTSFVYSDLRVSVKDGTPDTKKRAKRKVFGQPSGVYDMIRVDGRVLDIEVTVTNSGSMTSDEVVQIYASAKCGIVKKAAKQLIGFERVRDIHPGESVTVKFSIPVRELAYYDVTRESLIIEDGDYLVTAASSSLDPGVSECIHIPGTEPGIRDLSRKIKADHFDEAEGAQIVEGMYGYSALMAEGHGVYDPLPGGHFRAVYRRCRLPEGAGMLRIHGYAPSDANTVVYIDGIRAGEVSCNTRDYEKKPSEARNRMPRAVMAESGRKRSLPLLWTDIMIPLDTQSFADKGADALHTIEVEVNGPFKYDWFSVK